MTEPVERDAIYLIGAIRRCRPSVDLRPVATPRSVRAIVRYPPDRRQRPLGRRKDNMSSTTRRSLFFWIFPLILAVPGVVAAAPEGTVVIGLSSLGAEDWLVPARPQANAIAIIPVFNTLLERDDQFSTILHAQTIARGRLARTSVVQFAS